MKKNSPENKMRAMARDKLRRATDPEYRAHKNKLARDRHKRKMATDPKYAEKTRRMARERSQERRNTDAAYHEKCILQQHANRERDPEKYNGHARAYHQRHPSAATIARLKMLYGITLEQWHQILEDQGHACKICGATEAKWCVDHVTSEDGKPIVRGILCHPCNTSLKSHLTPELLRKMAVYVATFGQMDLERVG